MRNWCPIAVVCLVSMTAARAEDAPPKEPPPGVTESYDVHDLLWGAGTGREGTGPGNRSRAESAEELVEIFAESVDPGSWKHKGGKSGEIEVRDDRLVVRASPASHASIRNMLEQFRETPSIQGISVDCHFIVADEPFLKTNAPSIAQRASKGAGVRAMGQLKARKLVEAARTVPGVVVVPAPQLPLYYASSSFTYGEEKPLKLPLLDEDGKPVAQQSVETSRLVGFRLSLRGDADFKYVTLDLQARSGSLDALPDGVVDEIEGTFRDTFTVERSTAFVVCAPLVRARLTGVRENDDAKLGRRREVVRTVSATQSDPRRYLLVVGTVRAMSQAEAELLAGPTAASRLQAGETESAARRALIAGEAPKPPQPGVPPAPPALPVLDGTQYSYAHIARGLIMGSEPIEARGVEEAKRLKHVLARIHEEVGADVPIRDIGGILILNGPLPLQRKVTSVLDALTAQQTLEPD